MSKKNSLPKGTEITQLDQVQIDRKKNALYFERQDIYYKRERVKRIVKVTRIVLVLLLLIGMASVGIYNYRNSTITADVPTEEIATQSDDSSVPLPTQTAEQSINCGLYETENSISVQATDGSWGYIIEFVTATDQLSDLAILGKGPTISQQFQSIAISATTESAIMFCFQDKIEMNLVESGLYYFVKNESATNYDGYIWIHEAQIVFIATDLVAETKIDPVDRRPNGTATPQP